MRKMVVTLENTEWRRISKDPTRFQCFHMSPEAGMSPKREKRFMTSTSGVTKVDVPVTVTQYKTGTDLYSKHPTRVYIMKGLDNATKRQILGFGQAFRNWHVGQKNLTFHSGKDSLYNYQGGSPNHTFGLDNKPRKINYVVDFLWKTERGAKCDLKSKDWNDMHTNTTQPRTTSPTDHHTPRTSEQVIIQVAYDLFVESEDLVNGVLDQAYQLHPGNNVKEVIHGFLQLKPTYGMTGIVQEILANFRPNNQHDGKEPGDIPDTSGTKRDILQQIVRISDENQWIDHMGIAGPDPFVYDMEIPHLDIESYIRKLQEVPITEETESPEADRDLVDDLN